MNNRLLIWMVGTSFVLLQFFLQLSSGVIINCIMHEMKLSTLTAGLLSSSFYVIYTLLQIPVGMLCDRSNPRPIMSASALICGLGCVVFATSHHLLGLYLGRSLLAIGSAFSFVCLTHLIREYYPARLFGVLIGVSETLSFLVTIIGIVSLASMIEHWGWRTFIDGASIIACVIACLCWRFIPNQQHTSNHVHSITTELKAVLSSIPLWLNGLFIGFTFMIVLVFGALWAPSFLQIKLNCSLRQASLLDALFIFGVSISCPLFAYLSHLISNRKQLVLNACIATAVMLIVMIYLPIHNLWLMGTVLLILGLISGSYILGYTFANEFSPRNALSTSTGMTNTLALITTPILQSFIGYMLYHFHGKTSTTLADYQQVLLILPICILTGAIFVYRLPILETNHNLSKDRV